MKRLIEIKKGNYLNFKYFIFYVFNLQIKFKKNCPLSLNIYPTDKFSIVLSRSSLQEVFYKKVFLKTSKGHRKTPVLEFCFNKIAHLRPATLPKKETPAQVLPVNFEKVFRTSLLQNSSGSCFHLTIAVPWWKYGSKRYKQLLIKKHN